MSLPSDQQSQQHVPLSHQVPRHGVAPVNHANAESPLVPIGGRAVSDVDWDRYGGVMLLVLGGTYVALGALAIVYDEWSVWASREVLVANPFRWGWVLGALGLVVLLAGAAVVRDPSSARRGSAVITGLSILVSFVSLSVFPLWAIVQMTLGSLVLYCLVGRAGSAARQERPEIRRHT